MEMKGIIVTILVFASFGAFAQNSGIMNNWHFGWFCSLDFSTGAPIASSGSNLISYEGCISHSDEQGNLLFYSNGGSNDGDMFPAPGGVWNKNHQLMPNGAFNNSMGSMSAAQSTLVIQKSLTEYYLFTMGAGNGKDLRYCIIDMSLDGGLGDVTNMATILLEDPGINLYEGLTATHHSNGVDYWLLVHGPGNKFYTYLVSSTGITGPTEQTIGSSTEGYHLKISVQGDKILTTNQLYDFNNSTGIISNPLSFPENTWGHAFSPSGRFIYRRKSGSGTVVQYDLNASNILNSEVTVATGFTIMGGDMQLGPDLKLYVADLMNTKLGVINSPDVLGLGCNYVADQVDLNGQVMRLGLPNFIDSELNSQVNLFEEEELTLNIYPNPSHGTVKIDAPFGVELETIRIVDQLGRVVYNSKFSKSIELDLQTGTYIIEFIDSTYNRSVYQSTIIIF